MGQRTSPASRAESSGCAPREAFGPDVARQGGLKQKLFASDSHGLRRGPEDAARFAG